MVLQAVPATSVSDWTGTAVPLGSMVVLGVAKELYVEVKRWKDDKRVNSVLCKRLTDTPSKSA